MSIIKNFSLDSIKFNLKVKSRLNFNDLLWRYLKILNYARPYVTFFLKYLQAIDPLFVNITKPLNDNIGEETCVGLKRIRNPNI